MQPPPLWQREREAKNLFPSALLLKHLSLGCERKETTPKEGVREKQAKREREILPPLAAANYATLVRLAVADPAAVRERKGGPPQGDPPKKSLDATRTKPPLGERAIVRAWAEKRQEAFRRRCAHQGSESGPPSNPNAQHTTRRPRSNPTLTRSAARSRERGV
jgi:hypothetical protein